MKNDTVQEKLKNKLFVVHIKIYYECAAESQSVVCCSLRSWNVSFSTIQIRE